MVEPNHFDRSKPFYPLVVHYICQLFGFKELAAHGVARQLRERIAREGDAAYYEWLRLTGEAESHSIRESMEKLLTAGPHVELLPPLDLASKVQGHPVRIEAADIADDLVENASYLAGLAMRAAGSLLIVAFESTDPYHDRSELWEFLRHCRNDAAHDGRFRLLRDEPRWPARWASLEITKPLDGTLLFHSGDAPGLIGPGDALRLLWDIEQAHPQLAVEL